MVGIPALIAGEWIALPFAVGCGFAGGGLREICPKEAIWHFSPLFFTDLHRNVWRLVRRFQIDWVVILLAAPIGARNPAAGPRPSSLARAASSISHAAGDAWLERARGRRDRALRRHSDQDLEQRAHRAPAAGAGEAADGRARRGAGQPDQPALPLQHADLDLVADPIAAGNRAHADRQAVGSAAPAAAEPGALRDAARGARGDRRIPRHREHPLRPEAAHREDRSIPTRWTSSSRACCCSRWSRTRSSTGCRRRSAKDGSRSAACARTATRSSTSSTTASASPPGNADRVKTAAGIGLRNVNERLRVIYGANYQLQLDSVPGEGTCARIVIPGARRRRRRSRPEPTWTGRALRTIVVDDEQLAREELCFLLGQLGGRRGCRRRPGTASRRCGSSRSTCPIW